MLLQEESDTTERELEVNTAVSENENSNNRQTNEERKKTASNNANDILDETLSEAFQLLQQCAQPPQPDTDSYITFGQYISTEFRKYDAVTLSYVKNAICQVIFQADTRYGDRNYGYYTDSYPGTPSASTSSHTQSPHPQDFPFPSPQSSSTAHLASTSSQS
ncbi:hypothetical protein FQA39_LY01438 [Lamprigera yunnana]|nr:hypothetical protein FQA39_LY01438 [Lamprigera yunnana]